MPEFITYQSGDRIALISLNRKDKLNALNPALVEALEAAWQRFEASDDLVAVLTGSGRAFSVGADLLENPLELWRGVPGMGVELTKPVIGALHGHVIGGAFVLAMYCDLLVVADDTMLSYPEVAVGFTGGIISGLVARIPQKVASEFMLLGDRMSAQRAYEVGIVNKVVPAGQEVEAAMEWARRLAQGAPLVIAALKKLSAEVLPKSPPQHAAEARRVLAKVHTSADRFEGERAFREKRTPKYVGR